MLMGRPVAADHIVITGLADAWLMMLHVSLSLSHALLLVVAHGWVHNSTRLSDHHSGTAWSSNIQITQITAASEPQNTHAAFLSPLTGLCVTDHSYLCHNRKISSLHPSALGFVTSVLVIAKTNINFTIDVTALWDFNPWY